MITAIVSFFSAVFQFLLGLVTGVINWAREHPREAIIVIVAVVALVASNWQMHKWATKKAHDQDAKVIATLRDSLDKANKEVEKANGETKARDAKITKIEGDSKAAASNTEEALKNASEQTKAIVSDYEKELAAEKKKYRTVTILDATGKKIPVIIDAKGKVLCERFSEKFMSTTNKLVDNANAPFKK